MRKLTSIAAAGLFAMAIGFAGPAQAATPACGDTLTENTVFDSHLDCSGQGANTVALTVGANNITINLNGFTLSGAGTATNCPSTGGDSNGTKGILVNGFDNINILDGVITGFERGIRVENAAGVGIKDIEAFNNAFSAVRIRSNVPDLVLNRVNFYENLNDAMGVSAGSSVTILNSRVVDNCASGIFVLQATADIKHSLFAGNRRSAINLWQSSGSIEHNVIDGNNSDTSDSSSSDFGQISLVDPGLGGDTLIRYNDIRNSIDANGNNIERGIGTRISGGAGLGEVLITKNVFTNNPQGGIFIDEDGTGSSTIEVHKNSFVTAADLAIAFDAGATNWTIDASKNFVSTSAGYGAPGTNTLTTDPDLKSAQHCRGAIGVKQ